MILLLISLASYYIVAFVFSTDASYLTGEHYSTLIRFSHAALPAYFLAAPIAFVSIRRNRKLVGLVALLVLVTFAAIPVYQTFAASNLNLGQNPFSLSYRMPGVVIRDYLTTHSGDGPFTIMGFGRDGWFWTPGSSAIANVQFYPSLSQAELLNHRWQTFYVYGPDWSQVVCGTQAALLPGATNGDYEVVSQSLALAGSGHYMVKVQLRWPGG
ncbi:MAG: hypothetical protein LYZ66_00085 [Nitrososphaerales archaeon]|nr:hypothetical protein [Nitrososphaerales archaeon]